MFLNVISIKLISIVYKFLSHEIIRFIIYIFRIKAISINNFKYRMSFSYILLLRSLYLYIISISFS
uniref:Uncharacterized protein n=1 Tax=virus sp. ctmTa7 TaxID=2828255 RepID=A0A8S5RB86_9VIRU|nr:MAG TPA: hypothetical protein [virus sp. ctmTa7]